MSTEIVFMLPSGRVAAAAIRKRRVRGRDEMSRCDVCEYARRVLTKGGYWTRYYCFYYGITGRIRKCPQGDKCNVFRRREEEIEEKEIWIPVRKMMPAEDGEYLTTTVKGKRGVTRYFANIKTFDQRSGIVTAWAPLPEPYCEET